MTRKGESYTGIIGIPLQDQPIQETMDPIIQRMLRNVSV